MSPSAPKATPILQLDVSPERAEDLSWDLADAGALAVEERDESTMNKGEDEQVTLVAGFESREARAAAVSFLRNLGYTDVPMVEIDEQSDEWQVRWREFFQPVVLERLQVITPWMSPPEKDRTTIVIDPGQAFGTGGHETTKLVLRMMERRATAGGLPARVLDVGTGSGVLAIAARKLGATSVLGIDVDEASVVAFAENAERNGVDNGLECFLGDAGSNADRWPLVLANLQLDVFLQCASDVADRVAPGGEILISGVLEEQVEPCLCLFPGFMLEERLRDGEWAALALRRTP